MESLYYNSPSKGVLFRIRYRRKIATMMTPTKPAMVGQRFRRAISTGSVPVMAAAGITAQGMIVPPPTHTAKN